MSKILLAIVGVAAFIFLSDYLSLALRVPKREPIGSVEVLRYYEVALKNRKTEYMRDEPRQIPCVRSLLPHYGDTPCWYLEKHTKQTVKLGSVPNEFWQLR